MKRYVLRSWLLMSAVAWGPAATAYAIEPTSFMARRAEAILSSPADQWTIRPVSCTDDSACDADPSCDDPGGDMVGECVGGEGPCSLFGCNLFGDAGDPFDLGTTLLGEDSGWDVGGWISAGYTTDSDGVINTRPHDVNVHQAWLFVERAADGSEGLDWGFRFDAVYGLDGENTQAYGNNPGNWDFGNGYDFGAYHWALPQLYGVLAYDKLNVKIGHFYTPAGYEVVPANGNFFYSHAYTWNFTEPFTHTGALATYTATDDLTLYGGWVAGWDTGFDQFNGGSAAIGGATVKATDDISVTYIGTVGNLGAIGDGNSHHLVATVALTDKLNYILSSDITRTNQGVFGGGTFHTVSAANYLIYNLTDKIGVGGRAEWAKINGVSYYETTVGVNLKPTGNLIIRPEVRHNWAPGPDKGGANPIGVPTTDDTIFGIDAILTF